MGTLLPPRDGINTINQEAMGLFFPCPETNLSPASLLHCIFGGRGAGTGGGVATEKEKANSYWAWSPAPMSAEQAKGAQQPWHRLPASLTLHQPTAPQ